MRLAKDWNRQSQSSLSIDETASWSFPSEDHVLASLRLGCLGGQAGRYISRGNERRQSDLRRHGRRHDGSRADSLDDRLH